MTIMMEVAWYLLLDQRWVWTWSYRVLFDRGPECICSLADVMNVFASLAQIFRSIVRRLVILLRSKSAYSEIFARQGS